MQILLHLGMETLSSLIALVCTSPLEIVLWQAGWDDDDGAEALMFLLVVTPRNIHVSIPSSSWVKYILIDMGRCRLFCWGGGLFSFYVLHFSLDWCNGFTLTVEGDMLDMDGVCLIASAVQRLSIKSVFDEVFHSCFYVDKAGMSLSL